MPKTSTRRTSRLTTPVMITFVVVAVVMLGLTITSVVKAMTRGDDPVIVSEVLTGQSMEVSRTTGPDVLRFESVRAPLPPDDEDVPDTLDTCMAAEAREHLEGLAEEGTSLDVEIEAYAQAPNGELWAEIYQGGDNLALEMVEAGFAVVEPDSVDDPQQLDAFNAAQEQARQEERGIFSKDADCTLPATLAPILEQLNDLPASPAANDVTELTQYIGQMNSIRSDAQQAVSMLSAIPEPDTDDSVAALAWGEAKDEYINEIEGHLDDIQGLIEDAQEKRADLQDVDVPDDDNGTSEDGDADQDTAEDQPAEDQQPEQQTQEQPQQEPAPESTESGSESAEISGNLGSGVQED